MWLMTCRLRFPNVIDEKGKELTLVNASEIKTRSTFMELTGTAEIVLPRNSRLFKENSVRDLFRADDPVVVEFGYDGEPDHTFTGYIAQVSADIPIRIRCEDEMRKVKRLPVNYSNKSVSLSQMLRDICPGYAIDSLAGVQLGSVRFPKTNVGAVLEKLASEWNLHTYMRGKTVVCGKYYVESGAPIELDMEREIVENGLQYKNRQDVVLQIEAKSIRVNGDKLEFKYGQPGGDTMQLTYYNITVQAELEKRVKADYEKAHVDKWDGTVTTFGLPVFHSGEKVKLNSELFPDRNGTYYIEAVDKSFDDGGIRQVLKLGGRAA